MIRYYVEFKTWAEGEIETPWPFAWFEEIPEYRNRKNPVRTVSSRELQGVFTTFKEETVDRFLDQHTCAVILGAIVETNSMHEIEAEISKVFGAVEIIGAVEITPENESRINHAMKSAGTGPGASIRPS